MTYYRVFNPSQRAFTFQVGTGPWQPATIQPGQTMDNVVLGPLQLPNLMMLGLTVSEYGAPKTPQPARRIKATLGKPKQ